MIHELSEFARILIVHLSSSDSLTCVPDSLFLLFSYEILVLPSYILPMGISRLRFAHKDWLKTGWSEVSGGSHCRWPGRPAKTLLHAIRWRVGALRASSPSLGLKSPTHFARA